MKKTMLPSIVALSLSAASFAGAEVVRGIGEPMSFDIGYGIIVNEGSTLERQWVIVNDGRLPVTLSTFVPKTSLDDRNWVFDIEYEFDTVEDVQAIEVRFIPFNIWGEKNRNLSTTEIKDISSGSHKFSAQWRILSENDAVEHYAMLGYVAQVKLASGAILRANPDAVVQAAQQFSADFTSGDLSSEE